MRVLFWGTSSFATPSLSALLGEGFDVVGVVTQPDRAVGRSRSLLVPPAVKQVAAAESLPVLQPERPRGAAFIASVRALQPEISVVISYGHILRQEVIDLPTRGTINVHASLLPAYRGASPIQAAIRDGVTETGVTIMRMALALDAGPIILQARTPVAEEETYGELELRLSELGALALVEALTLIDLGSAAERPQDEARATYAGKIEREMARVAWSAGCAAIARQIRAYDPKPGAFTTLRGADVKLFGATGADVPGAWDDAQSGEVLAIDNHGIVVACADGAVRILEAQPAGRRRVATGEWARGRGVRVGDTFGV